MVTQRIAVQSILVLFVAAAAEVDCGAPESEEVRKPEQDLAHRGGGVADLPQDEDGLFVGDQSQK